MTLSDNAGILLGIMVIFLLFVPVSAQDPEYVIDFTANITLGEAPLMVEFTDISTVPGEVRFRSWNFGDGTTSLSMDAQVIHEYTGPGIYSVRMDRSDQFGSHSLIKYDYIQVTSGPIPTPTPTITVTTATPTPTISPTVSPTTTVTPTPIPTLGPEVPPSEFYGTVLLSGAPAQVGTVVAGYIHGEQRGNIVVSSAGNYGGSGSFDTRLVVHAYEQDLVGGNPVILFTVGGQPADQAAVFQSGSVRELGLTAGSLTPTPTTTTNTPTPTVTTATPTPTITTVTPTPMVTTITPTPTGTPTGTLQVFSTPTNASVTVDSVFAGRTPLFLPGISAGTHTVAVDKAGYQQYGTQAFIQSGSTTTVIASLVPVTPTPTTSPTLTPLPTFTFTPTPTTTTASPTPTVTTVSPTPTPTVTTITPTPTGTPTGTLQVFSTPTNASVTVDSVFAGRTPLFLPGISAGTHTVAVDKAGYQQYGTQAFIQSGSTTTVIASLVPVTPTPTTSPTLTPLPTFTFTPTPTTTTASPTPTVTTVSPTPTPTVTTVSPTPTPTVTTVSPTPTPTVTMITPTPTGTPTGTLQVFSTPTNASVTVDSVFAGRTPLFLPGISAGTHTVAVDKAGYQQYGTQAFIQSGSTTTVIASLVPVTPTPTTSPTLTPLPTFPTPTPTATTISPTPTTVTPTPTTGSPTPTPTLGPEVPPSEFYGHVTLDGVPAPAGTVVAGYIRGEQRGIIVVSTAGTYGGSGPFDARLVVHAYEQDFTGGDPVIQFTVGERLADQTATFQSGTVRELGLSSESPTPTPTVTTVTPTPTMTTVTPTPTLTTITPTPTLTTTITFTPTVTPTETPTTFPTTQPTPTPSATNLTLYTGWNFVSIPVNLEQGYNTAGVVFFGVDTAAHSLFSYNASTEQWDTLARDDPLTVMENLWIYSREPTRVDLVLSANQTYTGRDLVTGWNGFGIPGTTRKTAAQGMAPVNTSWAIMIGFDARGQNYESSIIRGGTGEHSDSRMVDPGKGYWVFMNRNQTYIPVM